MNMQRKLSVNQLKSWLFYRKIKQKFELSSKNKLKDEVRFGEFLTCLPEKGRTGCTDGNKNKRFIILEVSPDSKSGRIYRRKILDFKKETIYPICETMVYED